jgi:SAM-dependent methyltransferase
MPANPSGITGSRVTVLSPPKPVRMGEEWFKLATLDHFWIRRRFDVCEKFLTRFPISSFKIGEIGCGHGAVQRQFEDRWNVPVDGFDLNMSALEQSLSRQSSLYCYDVLEQRPDFEARYDLLLLFDVIEHIDEDEAFLQSALFHLKPSGMLLVNVPADMYLFSQYDTAAGHVRRYDFAALERLASRCELRIAEWTYWGLPLYPLLVLRKLTLRETPPNDVMAAGFSRGGALANSVLHWLAKLEHVPQHIRGTSIMSILTR